jgi:hypothetical protein
VVLLYKGPWSIYDEYEMIDNENDARPHCAPTYSPSERDSFPENTCSLDIGVGFMHTDSATCFPGIR